MSTQVNYNDVQLIKKEELVVNEAKSTDKLKWIDAVEGQKIWMGKFIVEPGTLSKAQHHGNVDAVHYVYDGEIKFLYGEGYQESVVLKKGDFIYFPPFEPYKVQNETSSATTLITTMAPQYVLNVIEDDEKVEGQGSTDLEMKIVRASELDNYTNQTSNLPRKTAIQAPHLWIGRVSGEPAKDSGAHHHEESETAGFIISGSTQILYGENFEQYVELKPGDFLRVPPFFPHIERNLHETEPVEFLTARNPQNLVKNLN